MSKAPELTIATAGNTLAPALAILKSLGFQVSCIHSEGRPTELFQAQNAQIRLVAEDPLLLLGLHALFQHRGAAWQPTDAEVSELLALIGEPDIQVNKGI